MGFRTAVAALVVFLPVLAACGESGSTPSSVVRSYEQAIVSRDGDTICATFSPKLRAVLAEQARDEQIAAGGQGMPRYDCGTYYHAVIGYPHENVERQFVTGTVLAVGTPMQVTREHVVYMKVPAELRIEFTYSGYSTHNGEKGAATFEDTVWLSKGSNGTWGIVKPSLGLVAASNPDTLSEPYSVARVNAPPPDPDYSMNRAERTAWEANDYRASFRRKIRHTPLRCEGKSVTVEDSLHDAVVYPRTTSSHLPAPAPGGNDIERVTVQVSDHRMCVAVLLREKPQGHLSIGFTPRGRDAFFPTYVVELDSSLGARGGSLTSSYRYFSGGQRLNGDAVDAISLYGRTVAFAADAGVLPGIPRSVPADLTWTAGSGASTGADHVPNQAPGEWRVIRQSDGRVVKPAGSR